MQHGRNRTAACVSSMTTFQKIMSTALNIPSGRWRASMWIVYIITLWPVLKTPQCNGSSKPLGGRTKCAASRPALLLGSSTAPVCRRISPCVTGGLQRIKTLSFVYISLEHQRCFGFIVSGNTAAVNVSWMHVLLRRSRSSVGGTLGEPGIEHAHWKPLSLGNPPTPATSSRSPPCFSSICPRASLLGLSCVNGNHTTTGSGSLRWFHQKPFPLLTSKPQHGCGRFINYHCNITIFF